MIQEIIEQHAQQAAFLWLLRDAAARAPHYDLDDLCELDERVDAHLDGLRLVGDPGWDLCEAALAEEDAGECFAAAVIAVEREDYRGVAKVLDVGAGSAEVARGIVAALSWVSFEKAAPIIEPLLEARSPTLRRIGVAACAAAATDPGAPLTYALFERDPALAAEALRAAGELGRIDLAPNFHPHLVGDDEAVRFWAAWSLVLLGDASAVPALLRVAQGRGPYAARACDMAVRKMDVLDAQSKLQHLASFPEHVRTAVIGAGALGDPVQIPWLMRCMDDPRHARVAGESFALITGAEIAEQGLVGRPPDGFQAGPSDDPADEDVSMDPDANLPWPSSAAVRAWFQRNHGRFPQGVRHFLGKPLDPGELQRALRGARQRRRASAALELALRAPGRPLFDVCAPGLRQRRQLNGS